MKKLCSNLLLFALVILLTSSKAMAHKVNVFAYAEGGTVNTESYFPDGRPVEGGKIEVYDSQENKLLEGTTDKEGLFSFKTPKKDDLKIVIIASMGHKNSYTLTANELSGTLEAPVQEPQQIETNQQINQPAAVNQPAGDAKKHPRHEKEAFPVAAVLGGLGFIFGLTALVMQLSNKKKG